MDNNHYRDIILAALVVLAVITVTAIIAGAATKPDQKTCPPGQHVVTHSFERFGYTETESTCEPYGK